MPFENDGSLPGDEDGCAAMVGLVVSGLGIAEVNGGRRGVSSTDCYFKLLSRIRWLKNPNRSILRPFGNRHWSNFARVQH